MLHTIIIYQNLVSRQNYLKIPKVSKYSWKFPIFPQNSQYSQWKLTTLKIPGNFASLVFGHIDKFWKEHDRQIKKNTCKNTYLGSFFISEKYVTRVLFVSPWTSLIPPLAIRVPPPPRWKWYKWRIQCEIMWILPSETGFFLVLLKH